MLKQSFPYAECLWCTSIQSYLHVTYPEPPKPSLKTIYPLCLEHASSLFLSFSGTPFSNFLSLYLSHIVYSLLLSTKGDFKTRLLSWTCRYVLFFAHLRIASAASHRVSVKHSIFSLSTECLSMLPSLHSTFWFGMHCWLSSFQCYLQIAHAG